MKDTVIKETGNSRFLRSALPAGTSWEDALAMLIAGTFPIDLTGINKEGIDTLGTALSKATLLSDGTEIALFGDAADRTVDNALSALIPWNLIDTIDNTVGYSGTWTAPDVFGDGSAYDLGVYMIGGGGSGAACCCAYDSTSFSVCAGGGASGYGKNVVIESVSPGDPFPWVIGKGGAVVTNSYNQNAYNAVAGNNGGATSFNGHTANGGAGGGAGGGNNAYISAALGGQSAITEINGTVYHFYGCVDINVSGYTSRTTHFSQSPRDGQNQFDSNMVSLACGMASKAQCDTSNAWNWKSSPDSNNGLTLGQIGTAASGTTSATAKAGTCGNGGGGAAAAKYNTTVVAKSGAGGDGVIFLYARKAVS